MCSTPPTAQLIGEEPRLAVVPSGDVYFPTFQRFYRQQKFYAGGPNGATVLFRKLKTQALFRNCHLLLSYPIIRKQKEPGQL